MDPPIPCNIRCGGIITVTSQLSVTAGGPLVIDGGGVISISGGGSNRIWWVEAGSDFILRNLAVVDGFTTNGGGSGLKNENGLVIISNCTFSGNVNVDYGGGGLSNSGNLSIIDSTFYSNTAWWGGGGAIYNPDGILTGTGSNFINNKGYAGGGIYNVGDLILSKSTISGNTSNWVVGITYFESGSATRINSTISGNTISLGPEVESQITVT
jgi:hypothetical protein